MEGASVVGVVALLADRIHISARKVAVVVSDGNIDPQVLSTVISNKLE